MSTILMNYKFDINLLYKIQYTLLRVGLALKHSHIVGIKF